MSATLYELPTAREWTLGQACGVALERHWQGMRKLPGAKSGCAALLRSVAASRPLRSISDQDLRDYLAAMQAAGLSQATVHARLCIVSTVFRVAADNGYSGPAPRLPRHRIAPALKWWLTPEMEAALSEWAARRDSRMVLWHFAHWTVLTGLRVEETLRVRAHHFTGLGGDHPTLTVPGTKTENSQATLAIAPEAAALALRLLVPHGDAQAVLFSVSYLGLQRRWQVARRHFGWSAQTATLKALRRSFARRLAVKGCPEHILQQMLRHTDPSTTRGYLRLVGGGYSTEEQRKWL